MNSKIEEIIDRLEDKFGYFENNEKPNVMPEVKDFLKSSLIEYGEEEFERGRKALMEECPDTQFLIGKAVQAERKSLLEKVEKMKETGYTNNPRYNIALEDVKELLK
jgi:hypothetical protein